MSDPRIDNLKTALVRELNAQGYRVLPKRKSVLMWMAHVLMIPFNIWSGRSFMDDYLTTSIGAIYIPVPKDKPQTEAEAIARVDVSGLAHELTHVYQGKRGIVGHTLAYMSPQLVLILPALITIPFHIWLAGLSPWAHLLSVLYVPAILSVTPLVAYFPWRPRYEIERDAYITTAFVISELAGYVDKDHVVRQFVEQLTVGSYLWPATVAVATRDAELAHAAITRRDPDLLKEPSRRLVRSVIR